jgi:hypothetical protein
VWFVAENPSLGQMERVLVRSPESQWLVSRGDRLFRDLLVKHGFKDAPWDAPGAWRCYVTDVVKSADRAGLWAKRPPSERDATVDAWAPVLSWELEQGAPALVVSVGKPADRYLTRLQAAGAVPRLPERFCVPHYSYIAMRPDRQGRGPGHPDRIAEYDAQFAAIAARAAELHETHSPRKRDT